MQNADSELGLRVGEWVEVKSAEEILATLDGQQSVDQLPFMPEMLQYSGRKFQVRASAHKTADTIELFSIRGMANTVHLEELRCDGSAHGACQASCLLYWKEAWLKRVPKEQSHFENLENGNKKGSEPLVRTPGCSALRDTLMRGTRFPEVPEQSERFRCQATEMLSATTEVRRRKRFDPRFYIKDLTSGNVNLFDFIRFGVLAMINSFFGRWFGRRIYPYIKGLAGEKTPSAELNLQPNELVRVKPKEAIQRTLNQRLRNRGLNFDYEMVPYCNKGPFRVLCRVERLINEKTGELMKPKNPCIILDGVTCSGNYLHQRMFSRRGEYMFFREIWLERFEETDSHNSQLVTGQNPRGKYP